MPATMISISYTTEAHIYKFCLPLSDLTHPLHLINCLLFDNLISLTSRNISDMDLYSDPFKLFFEYTALALYPELLSDEKRVRMANILSEP